MIMMNMGLQFVISLGVVFPICLGGLIVYKKVRRMVRNMGRATIQRPTI